MRFRAFLCLLLLCVAAPAVAHEVRPAFLQLKETEPDRFDVLWKTPARGAATIRLSVALPEKCVALTPVTPVRDSAAKVERWRVSCPGGLDGETIEIKGLAATLVETIARIERLERPAQTARLHSGVQSFGIVAATGFWDAAAVFLPLGVEHIWGGIDHLLFVLALMLLVRDGRRLVSAITAFTVSHSITLALATLGFIHVAPGPVEALIALSIVFVAAEALSDPNARDTLTKRSPWIVAFIFGLLHGLGFAGALAETGIPQDAIAPALLFFNIGVELGQLAFVAALALAFVAVRFLTPQLNAPLMRASAYVAGIAGAYWTIERVWGIFAA
jgi:hypothetical protein